MRPDIPIPIPMPVPEPRVCFSCRHYRASGGWVGTRWYCATCLYPAYLALEEGML